MNRPAPQDVRTITCIGGGVIGAGWAAGFLAKGYDVVVQDINAAAEVQMRRIIDSAWPSLEVMGLAGGASKDRVRFTTDLADAVSGADFVQESGPERIDIKQDMYAAMDAAMPNDVVIASSTSGLLASDIQAKAANPSRMVLGHPFNPPYLMPLVEVVGGKKTDPVAVDWARDFYRHAGKHALKMDREVLGHIADRLQQAMWNEIVYMVDADEATPEQIDESIVYGFGPRMAIMGYVMLFHLAGGEGGVRHFMKHFDPSVSDDWTRLPSPPITDELIEKFASGAKRLQDGRSMEDMQILRDEALVGFLQHFNKVTGRE